MRRHARTILCMSVCLLASIATAHAECRWPNASYDQSPIVGVVNPMSRLAATPSANPSSFVKERKYGL